MRPILRAACALAVAAAVSAAGLSGCTGAHAARDPNTLVVLEAGDAGTLNPVFSTDAQAALYEDILFDGLTGFGDDFAVTPALATSWTPSADGLTWTVRLRRSVKWSDGAPFTSQDVAFTWNALLDPQTGFPYRGQYDYVSSVRAVAPDRVVFKIAHPNPLFLNQALNFPILPEHLLGKIPHKQLRQSTFGEHPVGTGPYVLKEWRHDEQLTFEPNPHWWGGTQTVKRIAFLVVLNDQARIDAMEEGSADVDDGMGAASYAIFKSDRARVRLLHVPDLYAEFVYVNFQRPGLGDVNVRRAMMYGWDREGLATGLARGDSAMATSITPSGLKAWYDPHVRLYPFDPPRARAILDAAGYLPGPDGVRRKGNVRLSYVLSLPGNGGAAQDFVAEFQADMRDIGIAITARTIDYATFIEELNDVKFDLAVSGWGGVPDPDEITLLGSDQVPPNGNNDMHYASRRVDRDLRLGLTTLDLAKRKALYDDMQRAVAEDVPFLYFSYPYYRAAISYRVHFDFAKALPGQYLFRDVQHWRLDP